jgi:hypothetical protein
MAAAASAGTAGSTPRASGRWLRLRCAASRHGDASAMGRCYVLIDRGLLLLVVFAAGSYAPLLSQASCLLSVQTCSRARARVMRSVFAMNDAIDSHSIKYGCIKISKLLS